MAGTATKNKDMEMASRMKREGVKRTSARCPVCHRIVNLKGLTVHIMTCKP